MLGGQAGDFTQVYILGEMPFQPLLGGKNLMIFVVLEAVESQLPLAVTAVKSHKKTAGYLAGDIRAAKLLDNRDTQIAPRGNSVSTVETAGIGDCSFWAQNDIGVSLSKCLDVGGVYSGDLVIQQASLSDEKGAVAQGDERESLMAHFMQLWE